MGCGSEERNAYKNLLHGSCSITGTARLPSCCQCSFVTPAHQLAGFDLSAHAPGHSTDRLVCCMSNSLLEKPLLGSHHVQMELFSVHPRLVHLLQVPLAPKPAVPWGAKKCTLSRNSPAGLSCCHLQNRTQSQGSALEKERSPGPRPEHPPRVC